MHRIEAILFGMVLILFGIASLLMAGYTDWGFCEVVGIIFPFLGLAAAVIGLFDNGGKDDDSN